MRHGRTQKSSDIDTNERSLTVSETSASANIVTMPPTREGIASRLIVTVLNLRYKISYLRFVSALEENLLQFFHRECQI